MAEIRPFRGIRYNLDTGRDLSKVTAPPYDVISPERRREIASRDPHNVVHIDLPVDADAGDRYECAARLMNDWLERGVLVRDARPGVYVIRQECRVGDRELKRTGFIAAVKLEPFGEGQVYPHEETLPGPKVDRLDLMKTTHANLSQIFSIFPDEQAAVRAWLAEVTGRDADAQSTDAEGVRARMWCEFDADRIAALQGMMSDRPLFIADGHHRYETALEYRRLDADRPASDRDEGADAVMMLCVGMSDPGLVTLPTHRLLEETLIGSVPDLVEKLKTCFDVRPIASFSGGKGAFDEILSSDATPNLMILYVGSSQPPMKVLPRDTQALRETLPQRSDVWRSLDVSILQYAIFEGLLGLTLEKVSRSSGIAYLHDADEAKAAVDAGRYAAAFILRTAPLEAVTAVAAHREKMPPKSTFFYPKALTGMVIRAL